MLSSHIANVARGTWALSMWREDPLGALIEVPLVLMGRRPDLLDT